MSSGSFTDFLNALRAFESGVDYDRYLSGQITEWQIVNWVGQANWNAYQAGQMTWQDMQYTSVNSLGFVGYQFGEALLIDLGYYTATTYYGNGASTNAWSGTFTGKNGIDSLAELKTDIQEAVILDAFGYNLDVIVSGLANQGLTLADLVGTTRTYRDTNGQTVTVTLTETGIMAAAHLMGAWGTLNLLLNGTASQDEYGTSILKYVEKFGGYDTIAPDVLVAAHTGNATLALAEELWQEDFNHNGAIADYAGWTGGQSDGGDGGGDTGGGDTGGGDTGGGDTGGDGVRTVTTITWAWGTTTVLDFDTDLDVLDFGWFQADNFTITEVNGSTIISIPSNNQTYKLDGVSLAELSLSNIIAKDASAVAEWTAALAAAGGGDTGGGDTGGGDTGGGDTGGGDTGGGDTGGGDTGGGDTGGGDTGGGDTGGGDTGGGDTGGDGVRTVTTITWAWGTNTVLDFDTDLDVLDFGWFSADNFTISEVNGSTVISIPSNNQTYKLDGVSLADLSLANITAKDAGALAEWSAALAAAGDGDTGGGDTGGGDTGGGDTGGGDTGGGDTGGGDTGGGAGTTYVISLNGADITGFDISKDKLDTGTNTIHAFIIVDTAAGVGFMNPWNGEMQLVSGVRLANLTVNNFAYIQNAHLREGVSGALAWERGITREPHTVYARSHEVGQVDKVAFDPATDVVSFKYYSGRERLTMTDSAEGVVIADGGTGQKLILLGVTVAELAPTNFVFTFTEVREDHLDTQLGFTAPDSQIIDFDVAIAGGGTVTGGTDPSDGDTGGDDGHDHGDDHDHGGDTGGGDTGGGDTGGGDTGGGDTGGGDTGGGDTGGGDTGSETGDGLRTVTTITWSWNTNTVLDFDTDLDVLDFGWFSADNFAISEVNGSTVISIPTNNQTYTLAGVTLDELSLANITAKDAGALAEWTAALTAAGGNTGGGTGGETGGGTGGDTGGGTGGNTGGGTGGETGGGTGGDTGGGTGGETGGGTGGETGGGTGGETGGGTGGNTGGGSGGDTGGGTGGETGGGDAGSSGARLVAYFPEWGIYGRDYDIADVPAGQLTDLIYAFAKIDASGRMALYDSYAAVEKTFNAADSVDGVADTWDQKLAGNFHQIEELKAANPDLKVSIAVGGWTLSGPFSDVAATAAGRETFAASVVDFLVTYKMFDGIDFDWEYPGGGGLASNGVRAQDGENYALLLAAVRDKLDDLEASTGRDYTISVAGPAGADKIATFNLAGLAPYVDYFNVMAYDFHGGWETTTGHQAPMFDTIGGNYDIETAVALYLAAGVDPGAIVLGNPMYTRGWSGVSNGGDGGWNAATTGLAPGSFEQGVYDYKDLLAKVEDPNSGWKLYWDDEAQAAYVYNEQLKIFSTIETPASIALKSEWAQEKGLGGMMFWDLSNDATGSSESLLKAAYDSWVLGKSLEQIAAASDLTPDVVIGGNGVLDSIVDTVAPAAVETLDVAAATDTDVADADAADAAAAASDAPTAAEIPAVPVPVVAVEAEAAPVAVVEPAGHVGDGLATVTAISWAWGSHTVLNFDTALDTLDFGWFAADNFTLSEVNGSTVISIPSNQQTYTLTDVSLAELELSNIKAKDSGALAEWTAALEVAHAAADAEAADHPAHYDLA